jgi:outer membrane protein assembly factor BamB
VADDQGPLGATRRLWVSSGLDGQIYGQPLVVGGLVIVATEGDSLYGLDARNGVVRWRRSLGQPVPGAELPCGNIDPSGITGTPAADLATGTIFVVGFLRSGPHHELFALGLDGAVRWHRSIDPPALAPRVEQQRGALSVANGRVYVPFGGLYGDCGSYKGAVVSVAADGTGARTSYVVPTTREAGIWNPAGAVLDGSDLLVSTGNSASTDAFDYGNAVLRLGPDLGVRDYFAPPNWAALNRTDGDLGSLGPVLAGDHVVAVGKAGVAYLLHASSLGHVTDAPASRVCSGAYGGAAHRGDLIYVPCSDGLVAVRIAKEHLAVAWRTPLEAGSPVLAAGAVWAIDRLGRLTAFDAETGVVRASLYVGVPTSRFASLSAGNGALYVPSDSHVVAVALR